MVANLIGFSMNSIWNERKKGIEEDSRVFGLHMWEDGIVIIEMGKGIDEIGLRVEEEELSFGYFMFVFLRFHVQKSGKHFSICLKFWKKVWAGNINLGVISIQWVFKALRLGT